jgi:hypothetical protein
MSKSKKIVISIVVASLIILTARLVPIVGKQIELNKINKQIYSIEKKNVSIS